MTSSLSTTGLWLASFAIEYHRLDLACHDAGNRRVSISEYDDRRLGIRKSHGFDIDTKGAAIVTDPPMPARRTKANAQPVAREQRRAGRTIKHYRATARSFFLPAKFIVEMPGTGFTQQLRDLLDQTLARSLREIDFTHDGRSPRAHMAKDPTDQAAAVELWLDVGLSRADADDLAATLHALIDRFRACGNDKEPRYLVHLAAVRI